MRGHWQRETTAVQAVIEVYKGVGRPQPIAQFFPIDHLAGVFKQDGQKLQGASLDRQAHPAFSQFATADVQLKFAKSERRARLRLGCQDTSPLTFAKAIRF
jgi:hypothetical protein